MFVYAIPEATPSDFRESAAIAGRLGEIYRGAVDRLQTKELRRGPHGDSSCTVVGLASHGEPARLEFRPDRQTWVECDGYWMGYPTGKPPRPEQLERPKPLESYEYALGGGTLYNCPIIRRLQHVPMLPCTVRFNGRQWEQQVVDQYADLWERSARWGKSMSLPEMAEIATELLGLNYFVGPHELHVMGTFADEQHVKDVLLAALDEQFFIDCLANESKKKSLEGLLDELERSAAGLEGAMIVMSQPAENSS